MIKQALGSVLAASLSLLAFTQVASAAPVRAPNPGHAAARIWVAIVRWAGADPGYRHGTSGFRRAGW
jgi:hypothetical protein